VSRQLNLRVDDEFASQLEGLAKKMGRSMASVLETIGGPALAAVEEDLQFEADALAAWEEYELTGNHVSAEELDSIFASALSRAQSVADKSR